MMHTSMILDPDACTPAAAPPIESMVLFCYILSMGGAAAAAGANRGTMRLGLAAALCTFATDSIAPSIFVNRETAVLSNLLFWVKKCYFDK